MARINAVVMSGQGLPLMACQGSERFLFLYGGCGMVDSHPRSLLLFSSFRCRIRFGSQGHSSLTADERRDYGKVRSAIICPAS